MSQFNHVSQFLETALGLSFTLVLGSYALIVYRGMAYHLKQIRETELQNEIKLQQAQEAASAEQMAQGKDDAPQVGPKMPIEPPKLVNPLEQLSQEQRRSYGLYTKINQIFDEYLPVLMCCMVLGILVAGTYVLSAICFFCSLFFNLVFNYGRLYDKIQKQNDNRTVKLLLQLMANIFIIIYFIGLLVRVYFK